MTLLLVVLGAGVYFGLGLVTVLETQRRGGYREMTASNQEAAGLVMLTLAMWWGLWLAAGSVALGRWARDDSR